MTKIILFNKPYDVLSQFTDSDKRPTLAKYIDLKSVYPAGRLDRDSEGLLILTDDGQAQHQIANPKHKMAKTYWVQVEGVPDKAALEQLRQGLELKDGMTKPAEARLLDSPEIWSRTPPIRYRAHIPDSWLELTIREGRNRQVRRMTAAVGHPTLRLIRYSVGPWTINDLSPGEWRSIECPPELLKQQAKQRQSTKQPSKNNRSKTRFQRKKN